MCYNRFLRFDHALVVILFIFAGGFVRIFTCQNVSYMTNRTSVEVICRYDLKTAVHVCDCQNRKELSVMPKMSGNVGHILITNCQRLHIPSKTFTRVINLGRLQIEKVTDLRLDSLGIEFLGTTASRMKVVFDNVTIDELASRAINGYVDSIEFRNCHIGTMRAFSVNVLSSFYGISFEKCKINRLESQVMKKMTLEQLRFKETEIVEMLPHRALYELTISGSFVMENCTLNVVSSGSIDLYDVTRFIFWSNQVERIESDAFRFRISERISLQNNSIEKFDPRALISIEVSENYKRHQSQTMDLQFASNRIGSIENPIFLLTSDEINLHINDLRFVSPIDCSSFETLKTNGFLQQHATLISFQMDDEWLTYAELTSRKCFINTSTIIAYALGGLPILIALIIIGIIVFRAIMNRRQTRQMDVVMPEGKTYRETQIVMQIENAGLLKTDL